MNVSVTLNAIDSQKSIAKIQHLTCGLQVFPEIFV